MPSLYTACGQSQDSLASFSYMEAAQSLFKMCHHLMHSIYLKNTWLILALPWKLPAHTPEAVQIRLRWQHHQRPLF